MGFIQRRVIFNQDRYHPFPHCVLKLIVPTEYDTLLTWIDRSDNIGSDIAKYRFTNSKGCLIRESGFFKKEDGFCKDTLDRLTIAAQQIYGDGLWTVEGLDEIARKIDKRDSIICKTKSLWREKKIERINGLQFVISSRRGPGHLFCEPYEQLGARTEFVQGGKRWNLSFAFECKNKDSRNFRKRAYTILQSIQIDTLVNN
ncbi:hypothetical protein MON38_01145 [Hymenobacter sp. DH14]|uniref:Uncharacterized protein n=1 Tax=Hymenobacter cyanobacteriorum TaxID=2926463 RepID=A0A9X2ADR2_9BACT|nr:hypothetical protein [Hymenobacter cyanobacteriorum]MCI1186007.1 hypothetical protein [Hymenobacter cyanobacteriorum]